MNYPKKRGASGVIFLDSLGRVLLLEPTYKDNWEIPGGVIEDSESPKEAAQREVYEELGIKKDIGNLLCIEYQREQDDSYMFVFDGGILTEKEIQNIKLENSEIKSFKFCTQDTIEEKTLKKMNLRIQNALAAKAQNTPIYYETIY